MKDIQCNMPKPVYLFFSQLSTRFRVSGAEARFCRRSGGPADSTNIAFFTFLFPVPFLLLAVKPEST